MSDQRKLQPGGPEEAAETVLVRGSNGIIYRLPASVLRDYVVPPSELESALDDLNRLNPAIASTSMTDVSAPSETAGHEAQVIINVFTSAATSGFTVHRPVPVSDSRGTDMAVSIAMGVAANKATSRAERAVDRSTERAASERPTRSDRDVSVPGGSRILPRLSIEQLVPTECEDVAVGVDGSSSHILRSMNKPYDIAFAKRVITNCLDRGIGVRINLIRDWPDETFADFRKLVDFAYESLCLGATVMLAKLSVYPGTPVHTMLDSPPVVEPLAFAVLAQQLGDAVDFVAKSPESYPQFFAHARQCDLEKKLDLYDRVAFMFAGDRSKTTRRPVRWVDEGGYRDSEGPSLRHEPVPDFEPIHLGSEARRGQRR